MSPYQEIMGLNRAGSLRGNQHKIKRMNRPPMAVGLIKG